MSKSNRSIPGVDAWEGYETDLDVRYAYGLMFGKANDDIQNLFGDNRSIERAGELLFMPRGAFQYYVFAFSSYVMSEKARGDSDSASPFLRLLVAREERDPGSVSGIYSELLPSIKFVASHQDYYEAPPDIYGDFREIAAQLEILCKPYHHGKA